MASLTVTFSRGQSVAPYSGGAFIGPDDTNISDTVYSNVINFRTSGPVSKINQAKVINSSPTANLELWLFNQPFPSCLDNHAFKLREASLVGLLAVIPLKNRFTVPGIQGVRDSANIFCIHQSEPLSLSGGDGKQFFGAVVTRNAFTPVAGERYIVQLNADNFGPLDLETQVNGAFPH